MSARQNLPKHMKNYSIQYLRALLLAHHVGDPQDKLEDDVRAAILDQIEYLEYLQQQKWDEEKDK